MSCCGNEAGRGAVELPIGQHQQAAVDQQHDRLTREQAAHQPHVQAAVPAPKSQLNKRKNQPRNVSSSQVSGSRRAAVRLEQNGRQGRAEGQRVEGRDHRRDGDRHRELAEELAGDSAEEGGTERTPRTSTRATAMTGPVTSSMALRAASRGATPLLQPAFDVLDDDDGVVHHDADRQHQPEQRQVVEREAQAAITANVPTMATGTAISGISAARQFCRKTSTTSATRMTASRRV